MTEDDAEALVRFDRDWIAALDISKELNAPSDYTWMGLFLRDQLVAVHRSMRWGPYLLLKGLVVAPEHRGSPVGLRLAIALREHARLTGYKGVVVWVEPARLEREIAARLRIEMRKPVVHRFEVPIKDQRENQGKGLLSSVHSGTVTITIGTLGVPMVPDLVFPQDPSPVLHWVSDQDRIVVSGNSCRTVADLPDFISAITPLAQAVGAVAVEFPVMASDLTAMLGFVSSGARRLSRAAVCLGLHQFPEASQIAAPRMGGVTTKIGYGANAS